MTDNDRPTPNPPRRYSFELVLSHMRVHHPGCPKKTCLTIAARVSARNWHGLKIGAAVGIELQKHVRHAFTDYDTILHSNMMTREEARAFIEPQVAEILRSWKSPKLKLRLVRPKSEP